MSTHLTRHLLSTVPLAVLMLTGCPSGEPVNPACDDGTVTAATAPPGAVAVVNGQVIYAEEVELAMGRLGHDKQPTEQRRKRTLEAIVEDELMAQRAAAQGLEDDPVVQRSVLPAKMRYAMARRGALGEALFRHEIEAEATVDGADVSRYFDAHREAIETDLHIWQILRKDRSSIDQVATDLVSGKSFEEVAAAAFPEDVARRTRPWDLGYINWSQIPDSWGDVVYGLEDGEISGVIEGPTDRYWIVQLVERRRAEGVTLDSARPAIEKILTQQAIEQSRTSLEQQLWAGATVEYLDFPAPADGE